MSASAKRIYPATAADLETLPPTWRGEIIDGTLYAFPRPRTPHARVEGHVLADVSGPFDRGRGGQAAGGSWLSLESRTLARRSFLPMSLDGGASVSLDSP